jgi:hypothetical protein
MLRTARLTLVLALTLPLAGCYAGLASTTPALSFRPDPTPGQTLAVGRDCSFHVAGLTARDLSVREAARHALRDGRGVELSHVTSRLVYPAPFEVCLELEGIRDDVVVSDVSALSRSSMP